MPKAYYFGCWREGGHHLRDINGNYVREDKNPSPWQDWQIDAKLARHRAGCMMQQSCGCGEFPEGQALLHHKLAADGTTWTAMAFWDRSVDSRPSSNSAFMFQGKHDFDQMVALAKEYFPNVMGRFKFEIKEWA